MHTESAVRALHEQQRQHREDAIHAGSICQCWMAR